MLGDEPELALRPVAESLAVNAAGADGDLRLRDLIAASRADRAPD